MSKWWGSGQVKRLMRCTTPQCEFVCPETGTLGWVYGRKSGTVSCPEHSGFADYMPCPHCDGTGRTHKPKEPR